MVVSACDKQRVYADLDRHVVAGVGEIVNHAREAPVVTPKHFHFPLKPRLRCIRCDGE